MSTIDTTSLEYRQARWERMRRWDRQGYSLAQIAELEHRETGAPLLSRQRIRTILALEKPGTVGRPATISLRAKERKLVEQIVRWQRRTTPAARARADALAKELKVVRRDLERAEKQVQRRRHCYPKSGAWA